MYKIAIGLAAAVLAAMTGVYTYTSLSDGRCPLTGHCISGEVCPTETASEGGCCASIKRCCVSGEATGADGCAKEVCPTADAAPVVTADADAPVADTPQ